jgi:hypothetical protein
VADVAHALDALGNGLGGWSEFERFVADDER